MQVAVSGDGSQFGCEINVPGGRMDNNQVAVEECVKVSPHQGAAAWQVLACLGVAVEVACLKHLKRKRSAVTQNQAVRASQRDKLVTKLLLPAPLPCRSESEATSDGNLVEVSGPRASGRRSDALCSYASTRQNLFNELRQLCVFQMSEVSPNISVKFAAFRWLAGIVGSVSRNVTELSADRVWASKGRGSDIDRVNFERSQLT